MHAPSIGTTDRDRWVLAGSREQAECSWIDDAVSREGVPHRFFHTLSYLMCCLLAGGRESACTTIEPTIRSMLD